MFKRLSFMRLLLSSMLISLLTLSSAGAETLNFRIFNYYTKMEAMPIGFVKAPANIVFEKRGLADFENGDIATLLARGAAKATPVARTAEGYTLLTFDDGATIVYDWVMKWSKSKTVQGDFYIGTGKLIKGTGRYEGIQGEMKITGKGVTHFNKETKGDAYFDVTVEYTISSKL